MNYHPLVRAVSMAMRQHGRLPHNPHLLVAVSGGADSTALLRVLAMLAPRRDWGLTLTVGHVHHHLHNQADAHADFVAKLAGDLGLASLRRDVHVQQHLDRHSGNVENAARLLRYAALESMAHECGADAVAVAHHGDDQLETLLMRLARGSGPRGLRGLRWRRALTEDSQVALVRPMLAADRAMVLDFLTHAGQDFVDDPTNADACRDRARLRAEVTPAIRAIWPKASRNATQVAEQVAQQHEAVTAAAREIHWRRNAQGDRSAMRSQLRLLPRAAVVEALRRAGAPAGRTLEDAAAAALDRKGGQRVFEFPAGLQLLIDRERVTLKKKIATDERG